MGILLQGLVWIDGHPWIRDALNFGLVGITGVLALAPLAKRRAGQSRPWRQRSWVFFVALGLALLFCRIPVVFFPQYLNVDEAMLVGQALTYEHYPMPWRDVDPTTNGPLNGYVLLWSVPFGLQPSYAVARLTGLFCIYGLMVFLCSAGRRIAGDFFARISILPIFLFQCFAYLNDYLNYTNEQVSLLLIGWAIYLIERLRRRTDSAAAIIAFGLVVGLLPWAKLQSVLPGAALDLIAAAFLILRRRSSLSRALGRCGLLALATVVPSILMLLMIASAGSFNDFWQSYIEMARNYGASYPDLIDDAIRKMAIIGNMVVPEFDIAMPIYLMLGLATMMGVCLWGKLLKASRVSRDWYWAGLFLTVTMVVTILVTNLVYLHYQFFLLPAFVLLVLASFRLLRTALRTNRIRACLQIQLAELPVLRRASDVLEYFSNFAS
jgi:hypothetical protein